MKTDSSTKELSWKLETTAKRSRQQEKRVQLKEVDKK
tara:strand:+ start:662 stop:772 length:111 start_codon:yes stop_codon:yes gene_type:complete